MACVCYNTNTNEDRNRLAILSKRLQRNFQPPGHVLEALVATALIDDRSAAHWLVNHADDPSLAGGNPREFYLLLCPVNDLESRVQDFWTAYRGARGWCPPMDYVPHVPLLEPFEALSDNLMDLYHAFNTVSRCYSERCPASDFQLSMPQPGVADTALAFQLCEPSLGSLLSDLAAKFAEILQPANVHTRPLQPPYRMDLCQDFLQSQQTQILMEASEHFPMDARNLVSSLGSDTAWQLRLYSRDVRLKNCLTGQMHSVYRMQAEHLDDNSEPNCLSYSMGDRIALVAPANPVRHGWALGLNCETGQMGQFQVLGALKIPCSSVWTLHKVANIGCTMPSSPLGNSASSSCWASFSRQSSVGTEDSMPLQPIGNCGIHQHKIIGTAPGVPPSDASGSSDSMPPSPKPVAKSTSFASFFLSERRPRRQLHLMRHGERLDTTVGFNWFTKAFDQKGVFANRFDLNIPELLPTRPAEDFDHDTPLSLIGQFVSYHVGEALARSGVRYTHAYSSPALRCVQTAHFLLHGAGQPDLAVRIEPLLNEFPYDDCVQMPNFLTPTQLRASGYNVNAGYKPHSSLEGFDKKNTPEKYQQRLRKVLNKLLDATRKRGGPILIVGHRTTLEFCPLLLMGRKSCSRRLCVPYNAMLCLQEAKKGWSLANCPSQGFTINEHCRFDGSSLVGSAM